VRRLRDLSYNFSASPEQSENRPGDAAACSTPPVRTRPAHHRRSVPYAALAQVQRAAELGECRALASGHGLTVTADADPLLEAPTSEDAAAARLIAPSGTFV